MSVSRHVNWFNAIVTLVVTCAVVGFSLDAHALTAASAQQQGLAWLSAQVAADGTLLSERASIATPIQVREECARTLHDLATLPGNLSNVVARTTEDNSEYTSRRILAASVAGQPANSDIDSLLLAQNSDGGWGLSRGYASEALDTSFALQALAAANAASTAAIRGLEFLAQSSLTDGGWGIDRSNIYATANVLIASNSWATQGSVSSNVTSAATNWLLESRSTNQNFGNTLDDAISLLALATQPGQGAMLEALTNALISSQRADGSWEGDPYLTALALRAIYLAGQAPVTPTTGGVVGNVIDQTTGRPLSNASIVLLENAGINSSSASDGTFQLINVPASTYTLRVSHSGYQSLETDILVAAGQTLNVNSVALVPISTTAVLRGAVKDNNGSPLQNVIVAVGAKSALSDVTGEYQIVGIPTGSATVTAALAGYKTVTASVPFVAGTTFLFSPTMYPSSVTPPSSSVKGEVIDEATGEPVADAAVVLNGITQVSDASGIFSFPNVAAGSYAMAVSSTGYQATVITFGVVAGVNDLGTIALTPLAATTTLQGHVLNTQGNPIAGASIALADGTFAMSDDLGAYVLGNLSATRFNIAVSAPGYLAQTFAFSISAPGKFTQDFQLTGQAVSNVTLGPLTVAPSSGAANANLSVSATLVNGGDADFQGGILLEVYDIDSNLVGAGAVTDGSGFSLGTVTLAPGESIGIIGRWNTGQFSPGAYQFELRLIEPNSSVRALPLGALIQDQFASFEITPTTHFTGTVAADPPVIQAGVDQAVHFTGVVRNDGNVAFSTQPLTLTVADAKSGTIVYSANAEIPGLESNALTNADFGSWIPTVGGNYVLTITASDAALGKITGRLYVGNVAQASFTVNPDAVLAGTRAAHANIHVAGVDPATATITDPLAPLIKTAIQKAVSYNDTAAHTWIDAHTCMSCHIGTQALIGGELTRQLTTYNALDRSVVINNVSTNQVSSAGATNGGLLAGGYPSSYEHRTGAIALWGLLGYHDVKELQTVVKRAADWVVRTQSSGGEWETDFNGAWFDNNVSMSMLNLSNLRRTEAMLDEGSITSVPTYSVQTAVAAQPASSRGFLVASQDGNLYYTDRTGASANLVKPDGTLLMRWTGFNDPRSIVVKPTGEVLLSSTGGTYRLNSDGSSTKLTTDNMSTLAVDGAGSIWGVKTGDTKSIYKLDSTTGKASVWLSNGPFNQICRLNPADDATLYVTDCVNGKLYQVQADKSVTVLTELIQGYHAVPSLIYLLRDGDHWLLSTTNGIYRFTSDWTGQRITWSRADQMVRLPDGTVAYVTYPNAGIRTLVPGAETVATSRASYRNAISKGTSWLQSQPITATDNMHLAQKLWGLGEAYRYYKPLDAVRAASIYAVMKTLANQLRANQASDGGWGKAKGNPSDSLVTAQAGIALDYLDPSASDPAIRKAVAWLLSQQDSDGAWFSPIFTDKTKVSTTTMVAIWLPMILDRLGAIDAQVSATFPPNVQPSSFDPAPTQTSTDGTGKVTVNWSLVGVTNDGVDLGFDLTLLDMQPGETRLVASDAHMTFNNSFNQQTVTQPIDIPDVTATARVTLTVATDHPDYPANATAQVTTKLVNLDDVEIDGDLLVNVYDRHGALVGTVTQRSVAIPPAGSLPVTDPFQIGTIVPAQYTVKAVLSDPSRGTLADGQTAFNVLPDDVSASALSTVHTDKQVYNPTDQVQILSRVESVAANTVLQDISLHVNVYDASNALKYTHTYPIAQLLPGQDLDFTGIQTLTNAPPGLYAVKQDLFDAEGSLFNHVEAAYSVGSTSDTGFGLVGTIAALPKSLPVGGMLSLDATATNLGNGALNELPLTITILDPDDASILQQFDQTSTIGIGATVPFTPAWKTHGTTDKTYYAILSATVGTGANARSITLAVDTFELTIKLDADITITPNPAPLAALVLVDPDTAAGELAQVDAALAAMDYAATFASSQNDFASGVRSGAYQLYLLLAADVTPDDATWRLLREAVHRGDGILTANGVAALPAALAQLSGLAESATLPRIDAQAIDVLASAPGGTAHIGLNPALTSRIVVPTVAQTQANLAGRLPAVPDQGTLAGELAATGRIDIGYFGNDAGTNGSQLALASLGRIRNVDGSDAWTVWRIRNSGDSVRNVVLSSNAGGYAPALAIAGHSDSYIASPIVVGAADHSLLEAGQAIQTVAALTTVFNDARLVDVGDNPGAIALWANQIGMLDVLDWTGSQHVVHGAVHSNSDIRLAGAQNVIDGPVHFVTTFANSGNQNTFTYQPRPVGPQPLPTLLDLDDFKPGGPVAAALGAQYIDASAECAASHHGWQRNASQMPIAAGLYWIPCDVHVNGGNGTSSNVTLISTGAMQIDGVKGAFQPFYQGIQFATSSTSAGALQLSGDATRVGGLVFAPNGTVQVSGSSLVLQCSVIGNQIRFANAKTTIDARQCAYATVERKAPAVLLNAFGEGWAGYAVFDWAGAIARYDSATSGKLGALFGDVLAEVAPLQNPLRTGSVVPFKLDVRNLNDAFTGEVTLQVSDDSTLVPPVASWAIDFTQRSTFTTTSNVRLGSGTTTDLTATVSAATPIVISPVAQSKTSIAHLPGESIADLITAFTASAGTDAALVDALAYLQAAQVAFAAGDREGAIDYLLDAAEACGRSVGDEADSLRTRVDWVIWALAQ